LRQFLEKCGHKPADNDDAYTIGHILEKVFPHAEKEFGKTSTQMIVFRESISMLANGNKKGNKQGVQYHDVVLKYTLSLLSYVDKATYEELQKLMMLPAHHHVRRLKGDLVDGENGLEDGPRRTIMRQMKKVAEEENWDADPNDIVIAFDSMIIRSQMLLSSKKGSRNKLIGAEMTELLFGIQLVSSLLPHGTNASWKLQASANLLNLRRVQ
jgi:hypothetical protein